MDDQGLERRLVERAASGDVDAFERLYRREVGRVYAVCLRMTAEPATAEDITQDVFVRAWQKLASFRGDSALCTWLFRLAVNAVISHRRRRGSRSRGEVLTDDLTAFDAPAGEPAVSVKVDVERAIGRLPAGARAVFVLHDVEGLRHEDVAALLGVAVGTSKAQLHRARTLLREALQ